ncbi:two-component system sensor histidine kinase YesM [Mobilisporobacter senegalensis]|uniref:Two-component system sensor histidine kinase YesM n=1 Tax=Mobilisporobacter senegalensis TaxID=1329262 RepID=A0A3N1XUZ7_9FIRM|nr:histidine kinase [Mobilisporobacter senegalensis]ROR30426.1 two-component system sensor histidine kinase YesM [Mobilisporobacter senegalensis]
MKERKLWFLKQKLNIKFTFIIGIIVVIPVSIIFLILFQNMKNNIISQELSNLKYNMNQNYSVVQKTVDLCNMSTQVFLNYQNLNEFLIKLEDGVEVETSELVAFYKDDIGMLERLVNSNPYLYQIRVYANNNSFSEMMPILYRNERMQQLKWAKEYSSGEWQFDYKDELFSGTVNSSDHTMALVTSIENYERGNIGTIEVAVRMDTIFPEIFQTSDNEWGCFVDKNGKIYSQSEKGKNTWEKLKGDIVYQLEYAKQEETYISTKIAGERVVIGIMPMKELSGYTIRLVSMEERLDNLTRERNLYFSGLTIAFIVLGFFINIIVKALLYRFYKTLSTIRKIQDGDLEARVEHPGTDEMGELGININLMLDTIQRLMEENINRELLMKNSEIRALQNQINAHFIYNVLESIKMMAEIDEKYEISDAVTSLGKLLRYGMKWSTKNVTVGQEIDYIKNYLDLINLRFDYQINLALTIPNIIYAQQIPKMSLQPIVENAIYHGIEELAEDSSIYIKAIIEDSDYVIEITDSGRGMSEEEVEELQKKICGEIDVGGGSGNGIGLKNVQDRIQIAFGMKYGISVVSKLNCYTKVIIKLPITHSEVYKVEETVDC